MTDNSNPRHMQQISIIVPNVSGTLMLIYSAIKIESHHHKIVVYRMPEMKSVTIIVRLLTIFRLECSPLQLMSHPNWPL